MTIPLVETNTISPTAAAAGKFKTARHPNFHLSPRHPILRHTEPLGPIDRQRPFCRIDQRCSGIDDDPSPILPVAIDVAGVWKHT